MRMEFTQNLVSQGALQKKNQQHQSKNGESYHALDPIKCAGRHGRVTLVRGFSAQDRSFDACSRRNLGFVRARVRDPRRRSARWSQFGGW